MTELIRRQFGVRCHPYQVGRILQALGWTRQQPALRAARRDESALQNWREHWPAMGGVTPQGKLHLKNQARPYCAADVAGYLRHLLRQIPGKLLVVWDGAPSHRGDAVKEFMAQGAAQRLHLAQLPPYAPELNPRRRPVELPETGRVAECLLPEPAPVAR